MLRITCTGAEAVAASFEAAAAAVTAQKPQWLTQGGEITKTAVAGEITAQGLVETGALLGSGRVFGLGGDGISVGFGQGLEYAQALERGAMPHPIVASRASNLKFYWEKAGMWFLGPAVMHPGNRPYAYARNGAAIASPIVAAMVIGRIRAIFS